MEDGGNYPSSTSYGTGGVLNGKMKLVQIIDTLDTVKGMIEGMLQDLGGPVWDMLLNLMEDAINRFPTEKRNEIEVLKSIFTNCKLLLLHKVVDIFAV